MTKKSLALVLTGVALQAMGGIAAAERLHAISMHGEPALNAGFTHFPYANPDAPKGGAITYCVSGTYDSLNPFILKSMRTTARGIIDPVFGNFVFEPLMQRNFDEPFALYGHLAQSIDTDTERTYVEFIMNPAAKWSDGKPVTADDVIFTFETFKEKGRPPFNQRLDKVAKMEKTADGNGVRFTFNEKADRETPLILGLVPIIPKHATDVATFDASTLKPMIGSGPYVIDTVTGGERITYKRNPDYWAKDLPQKKGFDNYDTVTIEYFRDETARFEAFKKGLCAIMPEENPAKWETEYGFPAVAAGDVVKGQFKSRLPSTFTGLVFNTRRPVFADVKVRRALSMLYDFEWINLNLYQGKYARTGSYWQNSELSALGVPASDAEKTLLEPFKDQVLPEVMDGTWKPSQTDGSGRDRNVLRAALGLLTEAGYKLQDGTLIGADGKPLTFEFLTGSPNDEKLALAYQRTAEKLGVKFTVRTVDDAQLQQRRQTWDYDMIVATYANSLSPGVEQTNRWGSASRDAEGTFNYAGVASPAIDVVIAAITAARDRAQFVDAVRALDRLLISGAYMIPTQNNPEQWLAHWKQYKYPDTTSLSGYQLPVWWQGE